MKTNKSIMNNKNKTPIVNKLHAGVISRSGRANVVRTRSGAWSHCSGL